MISDEDVEEFLSKSHVMVFRPTLEEFKNFSKYLEYMEQCGAAKWGVAKIVPPEGWKACRDITKNLKNLNGKKGVVIENPILQEISSTHSGIYQQMNIEQSPISVPDFKKKAESDRYKPPEGSLEFLEQRYWRGLTFNAPMYGADVQGSLYDTDVEEWNIPKLGDVLDEVCQEMNVKIPGVNSPYLYFGMWRTTFPWHVEDMDLHSINYLHYGKPKFWYAIPECHAARFETMIKGIYPDFFKVCPEFLRHKMTIVSPKNLARNGIPVNRMVQRAGEFMVTFPHGYHSGFNMGYNAAESVNFALHRWVELGKVSKFCVCYSDTVSINMDEFIDGYNALYDKDIQKSVRKQPKKTIVTPQNDELLKKMRPRRKLADYRSENNTRAIARRTRHRQKMKYRNRKMKRVRSKMLLKRCVKRACCRDLFIDPLPELDHEVKFESDEEEEGSRVTRSHNTPTSLVSSIKILPTDPNSPKFTQFPPKLWYSQAMGSIEKDFTLRGENVPLRSVYVRPWKSDNIPGTDISNVLSEPQTATSSEIKIEPEIKPEPEDVEEPKILIQNVFHEMPNHLKVEHQRSPTPDERDRPVEKTQKHSTFQTEGVKPESRDDEKPQPVKKEKQRRKRKRKGSEISLDLPDSFMLSSVPHSLFADLSASDSGKDLSDFSELMEKIDNEPPRVNKRRTRKNKGGRPNKVDVMKLQIKSELEPSERLPGAGRMDFLRTEARRQKSAPCKCRSAKWESPEHRDVPAHTMSNEEDVYHVTVETTQETIRKKEASPVPNVGESYVPCDGQESSQSDWRLCIMHKVRATPQDQKLVSRKRRYLDRMRMKPTFGSTGPYLSQEKINAIVEAEHSVRIQKQGKRINVKLKDLIIFDRKIIDSNVENRDRNGRLRVNKCSAYSGFESMLKITWIFDHTYSTANTLVSPEDVVTVPIGDSRYKVIHVDIDNQTTKSFTGRSFVNQHAKWSPRILSMGHNIMAIFNYQAYSGTGFTFDDTATHPEPSVVRHVSAALCQKILDQRQHILVQRRERQKAEHLRKAKKRGRPRKRDKEAEPTPAPPNVMLPQTRINEEDAKRRRTRPPFLEEVQGDFGTSSPLSPSFCAPHLAPPSLQNPTPAFNSTHVSSLGTVDQPAPRNLFSSPRLQIKIKSVQTVTLAPPSLEPRSPAPRPQSDGNVASHQVVRTSQPQQQVISLDQFNFPALAVESGRRAPVKSSGKNKKFAMYDFREPDSLAPGSSQFSADLNKGCLVNLMSKQLSNQVRVTPNVSITTRPSQTHVDQMRDSAPISSVNRDIGAADGRPDFTIPQKIVPCTWDTSPSNLSERALRVRRFLESASSNKEVLSDAVLHRDYNLRSNPKPGLGTDYTQNMSRDAIDVASRDARSLAPQVPVQEGAGNVARADNSRPVSEEHIQWCLKTNNVDDFRVWDAANNLPVYKPPSERLPGTLQLEADNSNRNPDKEMLVDSKQNMQKLLFEPLRLELGEEYKKLRDMCMSPAQPTPLLTASVPPSVLRREEWRKLRQQKLAGVPPPEDEVQEIVTIYNPPSSLDPSLGLHQRTNKNKISSTTLHLSEEASSSNSMRFVPGSLPGLMPNPDSADFQLYRSNFESNH